MGFEGCRLPSIIRSPTFLKMTFSSLKLMHKYHLNLKARILREHCQFMLDEYLVASLGILTPNKSKIDLYGNQNSTF